ncbi:hypothetical protein LAZ67_X003525 [Cordylochernes scorpioides]|uniref:Mos1 transposase HTH domain-containing protein n=1 Tax=Cordylochernes scorpioides TaxID=51811 RepID=A0ABY6LU60_9ARAC|nr:hypothetical protein LAZ67_X003525 [Cordylochernes scorpioides]
MGQLALVNLVVAFGAPYPEGQERRQGVAYSFNAKAGGQPLHFYAVVEEDIGLMAVVCVAILPSFELLGGDGCNTPIRLQGVDAEHDHAFDLNTLVNDMSNPGKMDDVSGPFNQFIYRLKVMVQNKTKSRLQKNMWNLEMEKNINHLNTSVMSHGPQTNRLINSQKEDCYCSIFRTEAFLDQDRKGYIETRRKYLKLSERKRNKFNKDRQEKIKNATDPRTFWSAIATLRKRVSISGDIKIEDRYPHCLMYADDVVIIGESKINLQSKINLLKSYLDNLLVLNQIKQKITNGNPLRETTCMWIRPDDEMIITFKTFMNLPLPVPSPDEKGGGAVTNWPKTWAQLARLIVPLTIQQCWQVSLEWNVEVTNPLQGLLCAPLACSFRKIQIEENFWSPWKIAISEPKSVHLREVLLFAFNWKKSATKAHQMLEEVYGDHALAKSQCYRWFEKFQSGDFELDNEPR